MLVQRLLLIPVLSACSSILYLFGFFKKRWRVTQDFWSADHIAMVAIALGTLLGQLKASVMVLLMVTGGEALEDYAMKSANRDVEAVLEKVTLCCCLRLSANLI